MVVLHEEPDIITCATCGHATTARDRRDAARAQALLAAHPEWLGLPPAQGMRRLYDALWQETRDDR